jgi:hypothetical protein
MVFKADKDFVTKVALRAFAAPQLLRQFCLRQNRFYGLTHCYVDARTGVHREKVFLSLLVFFIQFFFSSCTTLYVYDTYENNRNTYEDDRVYSFLYFGPCYDYNSPYSLGFPNKIYAHYRNTFFFEMKIKDKSNQLIEAKISKAVLHKNKTEIPLLAASDGRIYMSASELYQDGEITYNLPETDGAKLKRERTLYFTKYNQHAKNSISCWFYIPINYTVMKLFILMLNFLFCIAMVIECL